MERSIRQFTKFFIIAGAVLVLAAVFLVVHWQEKTAFDVDKTRLEQAVAKALLKDSAASYMSGECAAEGHEILGGETKENQIIVYALTMVGEYGFENGHFIKVSGSGVIPAVLYFDGHYQFQRIEYPLDGAYYERSLRSLFPARYYAELQIKLSASQKELQKQERRYAQDYLKSIGREAEIGEYGDFDHILLTDVGVPVEVSNRMLGYPELYSYPMWLGNREIVQEGTRYIYELKYDADSKQIIYTCYTYDTKDVVEQYLFDGATGDPVQKTEEEAAVSYIEIKKEV